MRWYLQLVALGHTQETQHVLALFPVLIANRAGGLGNQRLVPGVLAVPVGIGPAMAKLGATVAFGILLLALRPADGHALGQTAACLLTGLQGVERLVVSGALVVRACRGGGRDCLMVACAGVATMIRVVSNRVSAMCVMSFLG